VLRVIYPRREDVWSERHLGARRVFDEAEIAFFADLQRPPSDKKKRLPKDISRICAVDAAYDGNRVAAVASVFDRGRLAENSSYVGTCSFPYISGLFYLREGPFVVEAVRRLQVRPQLVCFDAHGTAHPRSAGLAVTCGMVLGTPSVGIAKSLLVGKVVQGKGNVGRIAHSGKTVGFVTTINGAVRYWSAGYSVSLRGLESVVRGYALPCLLAMSESDRTARELLRGL